MSAAAELRPVSLQVADLRPVQPFRSRPEFDLLLACCADVSQSERIDRIRMILSSPLDWQRLLHLAEHHGVIPQVYDKLSALPDLADSQQLSTLRSRYQHNARKSLWFTGELVRILQHLESLGIEALPYKGPALAELLYGDVTQRQFGDLDILIHPAHVVRAKAALSDLEYQLAISLSGMQEQAYIRSGYEYSFDGPRGRNLLEVQWRILPRFYSIDFEVADFFEGADTVGLGGHTFRTLSAHDLVLVLCAHAAKHAWVRLSWLCDIAQLAKSEQLDWHAIQAEAGRLGIERILAVTFLLAHKLLGSAIPHEIQNWLARDRTARTLAREILPIIGRSRHYETESIPYFRLMMRLRERWQDRMRFAWRLALTPSVGEWSVIRLPDSLFPLYRIVRCFRLGKRLALTR